MYVFGKGQSATTVSAPQTAITAGTSSVITGTVLDQSPAQPGKAAVSDDSMGAYMEYLHMQQPIDRMYHNITITGVPVSIDTVDPNGNSMHIATVTSDVSGTSHTLGLQLSQATTRLVQHLQAAAVMEVLGQKHTQL